MHARLLHVEETLLPKLDTLNMWNVPITYEDAHGYLRRQISLFAPQLELRAQKAPAPWWYE